MLAAHLGWRKRTSKPYQVARVDVGPVVELIDLDGPRGFQRDILELLLGDLDELTLVEFGALHDVLVGYVVASIRVDLQVYDPMARLSWLNEILSLSEVAGYKATAHVTTEILKMPLLLRAGP
ncbi:hypothetical protein ACVWZR_001948 [Bradyrhizobium sp. i1.3.1]